MPSVFIEEVSSNKKGPKFKVRVRALNTDPISGQKTRNFSSLAKAIAFKKKLIALFESGNFNFFSVNIKHHTMSMIIENYLNHPTTKKGINPKHIRLLQRIALTPFGGAPADNLTSHHWYMLAALMNEDWGVKPQTAANHLSILNSALKDCVTILRYNITLDSYSMGISTAKRRQYIARSNERTRRPTKFELTKIIQALKRDELAQRRSFPLLDIVKIALETAARLGEICGKITWRDWNKKDLLLTIRGRKNPNGKKVISCFELSSKAIEIIVRQPQGQKDDPIFPYNPRSVGTAWRRLMNELRINDLHFHDLRAEALCRLYEAEWTLATISKVSGHKDLNVLNNFYLRLFPRLPSRLAA